MADALLGTVLAGRYRLVERLGEGAMSWVFLAEHVELSKRFAVKVLRPTMCRIEEAVSRFKREARTASAIGNEHIVQVTDFGTTPTGAAFLVMEFLEGEDLATTLVTRGRLPWTRAQPIALQLCEALQAAHDAGIVHRDVKPDNFFRATRGDNRDFMKVLDFGIAQLSDSSDSVVTRTGAVLGTPVFMAPEQGRGLKVDHRADIYSLGATVYALICGRPPFIGGSPYEILDKHFSEIAEPPSAHNDQLGADVDAVILRALKKDPTERYPTMRAFAQALRGVAPAASQRPSASAVATATIEQAAAPAPWTPTPGVATHRDIGDQVMQRLFGKPLHTPRRFGRYTVLRRLGQGAMGTVYLARDPDLDREVAIKVLRAELPQRERTTLVVEAKAMARLNHPNVVAVYDVGDDDGCIYVAMERVDGVTLRQWTQQQSRTWVEIATVYQRAADGLAAAHAADVVHRDFKPDNVLIDDVGRVCVADFGLAHFNEPLEQRRTASIGGSAAAASAGTPAYVAPEVLQGKACDATSDQFSFGVALYEALCGERPHAANSAIALRLKIEDNDRAPRPKGVPGSALLWRVVERCLAPVPGQRFGSMAEVATQLHRSTTPAYRRALVPAVAATLALSAVGGAYGYAQLQRSACTDKGAQVDTIYNADVADNLRRAMLATEQPFAADAYARVDAHLQAWTQTWHQGRQQACSEQSEDSWALRRAQCYAGQLVRLDGLVRTLETMDAEAVVRARDAAQALPDPAQCRDETWLATAVLPPPDDAVAQRVRDSRTQLAIARSLRDTGQFEAGTELAASILDGARTLGYRPLLAEASLVAGRIDDGAGRFDAARLHYQEAFTIATEIDAPLIASRAAIGLAEIIGFRNQKPHEGVIWAWLPAGYLQRLGDGGRLVQVQRGKILARLNSDLGKFEQALREIQAVRADAETFLEPDSAILTSLMGEEGRIQANLGNLDVAVQLGHTTVRRSEAHLGPAHPSLEPLLTNLMIALAQSERFDEARPIAERIVALNVTLNGQDHINTAAATLSLCNVLAATGEVDKAIALAEQAYVIQAKAQGPDHHATRRVLVAQTRYHQMAEDPRGGLAPNTELLASYERQEEAQGPAYADALGVRAGLYATLGQHDANRRVRQQRHALLVGLHGADHVTVGESHLQLAAVMEEIGAPDAATEHARRAVTILQNTPDHPALANARQHLARLAEPGALGDTARPR